MYYIVLYSIKTVKKKKAKVHPITGYEGPEEE
jgi:hypothetical protein